MILTRNDSTNPNTNVQMKKMFISMLLMVVLSPVSAQIVSSQSERVIVTKEPKVKKEKKPRKVNLKSATNSHAD